MAKSRIHILKNKLIDWFRYIRDIQAREKKYFIEEVTEMQALMPILMKRRNGMKWNEADRAAIRRHLRSLSKISPYLMVLLLPGGFFMLPALAWYLDRRRTKRRDESQKRRSA